MKLLALSAKKMGGKDSVARFIKTNKDVLWPGSVSVETHYFATPMKEFAINYLGVERYKTWGTDAQKNEFTHIYWEDLPNIVRLQNKIYFDCLDDGCEYRELRGPMTGRELLQYIGEDLFLGMYPKIWIRRFEEAVKASRADVILTPDPRKPEQIECIRRLGGRTIRLLRDPYNGSDRHISETALDADVYDQSNFDAVIDNRELTIEETNREVLKQLMDWEWVTENFDLSSIN